jgi:ribosomal protein S18 acetylase RimI-like enzyme
MRIRSLAESEAEPFRALRLRALRDHPDAFGASYEEGRARPLSYYLDQIRAAVTSPDDCILGAFAGEQEDELVGMVGFKRESGAKVRHRGYIWGMYAAPEARGQGIGRALIEAALAHARALPGLEQINLSVVTGNDAARALYRSLGFEVYGLERRALKLPDGTYLDEDHMALRLIP